MELQEYTKPGSRHDGFIGFTYGWSGPYMDSVQPTTWSDYSGLVHIRSPRRIE